MMSPSSKSSVTGFVISARADNPYPATGDSFDHSSTIEAAAGSSSSLPQNSLSIPGSTEQFASSSEGELTLAPPHLPPSTARAILVIGTVAGVTVVSSMSTGILTVALPRMAEDVHLANSLLLWPSSVFALTCGCSLLVFGSISDLFGNRNIFLFGCFCLALSTAACGLARTGDQLIGFRALQGVAVSMCLPNTVSILTETFPNGKQRNIGFACLGGGQPVGFSLGLFLGGIFVDKATWRDGWYTCAGITVLIFFAGAWGITKDSKPFSMKTLVSDIDWVGALLSSACLGLVLYVLAEVTGSTSALAKPANISALVIAVLLIPMFVSWVGRQERLRRPALIPNSLWKSMAFTAVCLMVLLSWAVMQSLSLFFSLFFQEVQSLSALESSLRFLPDVIGGIIVNAATGLLVHKLPANYLVVMTSLLSAASPLLMALINPHWPYWYSAFWAVLLGPLSADVLFTVSNLVITDVFPEETHALAGAVFNTISQFGTSLGVAIMASISFSVTRHSHYPVKTSPEALMQGYRVTFWVGLGWMLAVCVIGLVGLRKAGKLGLKRE